MRYRLPLARESQPAPVAVDLDQIGNTGEGSAGAAGPLRRALSLGICAGLFASAATVAADRLLDPLITREQKRRERRIREGSPHQVIGPRFARMLAGRKLTLREEQRGRTIFALGYGMLWGAAYTVVRRNIPQCSHLAGLPFAVPFYVVCDGLIAPLLRLTPTIHKIPWLVNVKELANHVVWTATAELVHRYGRRLIA